MTEPRDGADIQDADRLLVFVLGDRSAALYQRLQRLESEISLDWTDAPSLGGPARSSAGSAVALNGGWYSGQSLVQIVCRHHRHQLNLCIQSERKTLNYFG